jgi:hypothetical protein
VEDRVILSWQAKEYDFQPKAGSWYWAVGIVAVGVAAASVILTNYLFALIALLGGFTVMLMGSKRPKRHTYRLTDHGFKIGERLVPYKSIARFAIHEDEPMTLALETETLLGTVTAPLGGVDWRTVEMELKNRNVEEVESLHTFVDHVTRGLGLGSF